MLLKIDFDNKKIKNNFLFLKIIDKVFTMIISFKYFYLYFYDYFKK